MDKKLLIVACGMSQIPTFEAAKNMGIETIGVDFNPNACAVELADIFIECDIKDKETILEIAKDEKVDGIVVPGTDFPVTGAYVSEQMGFSTTPIEVARLCTSKVKQKKFLKEKGFLVPEVYEFEDVYDLGCKDFPMVIKPDDNMAARGTKKVYSPKHTWDTDRAVNYAKQFSRSGIVLAEKFEEGMELSVDSLVWEGEVFVFAVADRHFALDPYLIEIGHTMPSILNEELQREVIEVFTKAVKALGITHGSAKGDLKISNRGIMILEIANRISGGVLSGWTVPLATGYVPHKDLVKIHLGIEPSFIGNTDIAFAKPLRRFAAERNFLSIPGKLKEIQRFNMEMAQCNFIHFHCHAGDDLNFPINNANRVGSAVSASVSRNGSIEAANRMVKDTLFRLEPDNMQTEKFISESDFYMFKTIEKETDWYGIDFLEALEKVFIATEKKYSDVKNERCFWDYFYKGGIQGATYYADTYMK